MLTIGIATTRKEQNDQLTFSNGVVDRDRFSGGSSSLTILGLRAVINSERFYNIQIMSTHHKHRPSPSYQILAVVRRGHRKQSTGCELSGVKCRNKAAAWFLHKTYAQ